MTKKRQRSQTDITDNKKPKQTVMATAAEKDTQDTLLEILDMVKCLPSIQKDLSDLKATVGGLQDALEFTQKEVVDLKTVNSEQAKLIGSMQNEIDELKILHEENHKLRSDLTSLEAYGRRENLLFDNVPESEKEDCAAKVYDILENDMKIQGACDSIKFTRVHRLGPNRGEGIRPIIVRFHFYPDREKVWKSRFNLKETLKQGLKIFVREDFPVKMEKQRRVLYNVVKQAKTQGKKARLLGDKVQIEGKLYTPATVPESLNMRQTCEKTTGNYILFGGRFSPFSNFYPSPFTYNKQTYLNVEQLYQAEKAKFAGDTKATIQIRSESDPAEIKRIGDGIKINHKLWITNHGKAVMLKGLEAKFSQNASLGSMLLGTGTRSFVECNQYDHFWGNGWRVRDKEAEDSTQWRGKNVLGTCLDTVRGQLRAK